MPEVGHEPRQKNVEKDIRVYRLQIQARIFAVFDANGKPSIVEVAAEITVDHALLPDAWDYGNYAETEQQHDYRNSRDFRRRPGGD